MTPVISILPGGSVWGSADGEKYVISCCNSIQCVFLAHLSFSQKCTSCHRIEIQAQFCLQGAYSILHDDKGPSHNEEGQIRCALGGQSQLGNILARTYSVKRSITLSCLSACAF